VDGAHGAQSLLSVALDAVMSVAEGLVDRDLGRHVHLSEVPAQVQVSRPLSCPIARREGRNTRIEARVGNLDRDGRLTLFWRPIESPAAAAPARGSRDREPERGPATDSAGGVP